MMDRKRRVTKAYFQFARNRYKPLIQKLAYSVSVNATHVEELKSYGDEELLKCMICYNSSGSFITFLYSRLHGVFRHMRDAENRTRRVGFVPADSMVNIVGSDSHVDFIMMAQECLDCLNTEERYIIVEQFFNERSIRSIAVENGMIPSTVCRIKAGAINKMRHKYGMGVE